jgi:hypothetical protein
MNAEQLNWKVIYEYFEAKCEAGDCEEDDEHWLFDFPRQIQGKIGWSKDDETLPSLDAHAWLYMSTNQMLIPQTHRLQRVCDHQKCIRHYVCLPKKQNPPEEMENEEYEVARRRFQSYCGPKDEHGCINWIGGIDNHGYGSMHFLGKAKGAHDVAWMLHHRQSIPKKLCIRHLCPVRNFLCVNIEHLQIGTHKENMNDQKLAGLTKKGQDAPSASITNATARLIIASYEEGTVKERAQKFNVKEAVIRNIDRAKWWTWLMTKDQIDERRSKIGPNLLLSRDQVRKIKASKGQGTPRERATRFVVDVHTIRDIDNGRKHASVCIDEEEDRVQMEKEAKARRLAKFISGRRRIKEGTKRFVDKEGNRHWLWKGNKAIGGNAKRGHMLYFGKTVMVHTVAFLAFNNQETLEEGKIMRHLCRYAHCCNPDHLCPGTHGENSEDMRRDGTLAIGTKNGKCTMEPEIVCKIKATKGLGSIPQRARAFGVTTSQVQHIDTGETWVHLVDLGLEPTEETLATLEAVKKADANNSERELSVKMSIETVRKIKATKAFGTQRERAEAFGVTIRQVSAIDRGETWKNVLDLKNEPTQETRDKLKLTQNQHRQKRYLDDNLVEDKSKRARTV